MTEINEQATSATDTDAGDKPTVLRRGLAIERIYTTPGVHPYDEVTWEHRDVVQTNWKTGETVFEQRGVEFPDFWSVNASTIVTTKYFRGAVGTEQRERSLKQLIDRVVLTYTAAGKEHGYFATEADAEVFEHELTWALLHQVFSFNSPVWFNVGTPAPQQVSACQPYHSLVSTPDGLIPIGRMVEDNMVGQKVYDAHGLAEVLAVKHNGRKDVLRLTTKAGHQLDVTGDHLVWRVSGHNAGAFVEAATLQPGDQLQWVRTAIEGIEGAEPIDIAEAALAGWLQADGFVGQYAHGTNRSLTVEGITVNDDEFEYVLGLVQTVFPGAHYKVTDVESADPTLRIRRIRLYGEILRPYVERYELLTRGVDMTVPAQLFDAPAPVVAAYLRSIFQAEGYVSRLAGATAHVGFAMISPGIVRGAHTLLARLGIFSRVTVTDDARADRKRGYVLLINNEGDQEIFAELVGFVCARKNGKLAAVFGRGGRPANLTKTLQIASVESLGEMDVYDIQTSSGEYLSSGNLRVHNCFILAVDDTMDSILNWYKEEGKIFQGGSGAGLNLSRIRSSRELLSSGGTASGPVSFMRGADASAGTIKSGGATRRAAKMVVLDVDHPDIEEFIETKYREEDKIRALRDAGYDMDLGGADITSVQYQNANNSVRVTDEFMQAVENGASYNLRARTTDQTWPTDARSIWDKMTQAAWACADPGIQYDDTINDWHTNPETGRITASNPCSEYMSLDNSSCNLASLNLMKFLKDDDTFDAVTFAKTVELVITAMDISICFADFPTEAIGDTTRKYRQLGIGYANLGALLMASGLAYDSDAGRALAASITSLMTGTAYKRSAEIAGVVGPYDGFARNAEAHARVMRKHAAANDTIRTHSTLDKDVHRLATKAWADGNKTGEQHGWRNAQASVLAPTGTIGFMMDCDTTGIEPDFSLVKFKKLVGGGSMQIVNQTIPRALRKIGYAEETVEAIVEYIAEHGKVVDAPGLRPEHYDIFDCAVGERSIAPIGHVRMMSAVQPFISGAISKTVNMPETATVEEVKDIYFQGWKLGLKALAIYRDNCKVGQPLSDAKAKSATATTEEPASAVVVEHRPVRKRLPKQRPAQMTSFAVGGAEGYMTASSYPDDGLGEIFLKMSKQGSTLAGVMDAFSIAISIGLQYGVPLETFVSKFVNMRFDPAGLTDDPDVRMAQSVMDYIFRRLALDYLSFDERSALGIYTAAERARQLETGSYAPVEAAAPSEEDVAAAVAALAAGVPTDERPVSADSAVAGDGAGTAAVGVEESVDPAAGAEVAHEVEIVDHAAKPVSGGVHTTAELMDSLLGTAADAPMCFTCGTKMRPAGSCYVCEGCGSTSGCS